MRPWQDDLFLEKNLWRVYVVSRKFKDTKFNTAIRCMTIGFLVLFLVLNEFLFPDRILSISSMRAAVISWASDGVGYASQVLGFLIAGFTIFATLAQPRLLTRLAQTYYKETNVSNLKFMFFNFIVVIAQYVAFVAWCLVIKIFFIENGPGAAVMVKLSQLHVLIRPVCVYFVVFITIFWFVNVLIILKSFVWNVYQSLLISIAMETSSGHDK
jgi:hypothetical protein